MFRCFVLFFGSLTCVFVDEKTRVVTCTEPSAEINLEMEMARVTGRRLEQPRLRDGQELSCCFNSSWETSEAFFEQEKLGGIVW